MSMLLCVFDPYLCSYTNIIDILRNKRWRNGATGTALDLRSTGRGFKSYSGQKLRNNLGQVVHTCVPLSQSSIYNLVHVHMELRTYGQVTVMLCDWEGNRRPD